MNQSIFLLVVTLLMVVPIDSMYLPLNNLYSRDIQTTDLVTFTKTSGRKYQYSSIISTYPVAKDLTTSITIKITGSNSNIVLGCGQKDTSKLQYMYFGQTATTIGYNVQTGSKINNQNQIGFGVGAATGDYVTMKINLHKEAMNVEFLKNNESLGVAFGGLLDFGDVYIGISLGQIGAQFQVYNYEVSN